MPSTLPTLRNGANYSKAIGLVSLSLIAAALAFVKENRTLYSLTMVSSLLMLICLWELLRRCCWLSEEINHLMSRYNKNFTTLLVDAFSFCKLTLVVMVVSSFIFVVILLKYPSYLQQVLLQTEEGTISLLMMLTAVFLSSQLFSPEDSPLTTSLLVAKMDGLDYGSGMAYSYFYGYFNLILPNMGMESRNVRERMEAFESREGVQFETYKLLILIPLSLFCPVNLQNENNAGLEFVNELEPMHRDVAGVHRRVYHNSVYKIKRDNRWRYFCAEYATPLKTLKEVIDHNVDHANHYKKHQKELVLRFYHTLKKVLQENTDCTEHCELIFFDDVDERTGRYRNIVPVIFDRIREIQERPPV